jgi:uncharacterized small protein (DUF1192 family)
MPKWEAAKRETEMDEEDLLPQRQKPKPRDLSLLGIAELEEYIAGLEEEIARARVEIAAKRGHRGGAEALFKR